jgi:peroxiredoxin
MALTVGATAPDFTVKDTNGKTVKLSDYAGKMVVMYFYPKDDTPGCTKEACSFRDNYDQYLSKGITVFGVSLDDSSSHKAFTDKFNLPFPLLADTDAARHLRDQRRQNSKRLRHDQYRDPCHGCFSVDRRLIPCPLPLTPHLPPLSLCPLAIRGCGKFWWASRLP